VALSQAERERQIALKARLKAEEEAEEARIAAQMEADRVAAVAVGAAWCGPWGTAMARFRGHPSPPPVYR
jgi:hypothetical protein